MSGTRSMKVRHFFVIYYLSYLFWIIFTFQGSSDWWILVGRLKIPRAYTFFIRHLIFYLSLFYPPPLCFFNREIQNSTNSLSVLQNVRSFIFDIVTLFSIYTFFSMVKWIFQRYNRNIYQVGEHLWLIMHPYGNWWNKRIYPHTRS